MSKKDIHALDGRIETRIGFSKKNPVVPAKIGWLFHRKDYHEDGSISDTYGVDLKREDFLEMGGVELSELPVPDTAKA